MTGHSASIYSLAFSEESSLLVSGGADWTVRCWDVKSTGGVKSRENGSMSNGDTVAVRGYENGENNETWVFLSWIVVRKTCLILDICSADLVATFPTKRTPIVNVQFTPRNLCLVAGTYQAPELR